MNAADDLQPERGGAAEGAQQGGVGELRAAAGQAGGDQSPLRAQATRFAGGTTVKRYSISMGMKGET
jgi:hypothetical protein